MWRALHPDQFDLSHTTQRLDTVVGRLELMTVQLARLEAVLSTPMSFVQVKQGRKVKLPTTFAEVVGEPAERSRDVPARTTPLLTTEEVDALMGW